MTDRSSDNQTKQDSQQADRDQVAERRRAIKTAVAALPMIMTFTAGTAKATGGGSVDNYDPST